MKSFLNKILFSVILCALGGQAFSQVSTNKTFMVGTNNALRPSDSNFFVVNSNLLNQAVNTNGLGGAGGGGGIATLNGTGTNTYLTNATSSGETATNLNIVSGAASSLGITNLSVSSNSYTGKTNFANVVAATNLIELLADQNLIGVSGGHLYITEPTTGILNFGFAPGQANGTFNTGTVNAALSGDASGATNVQFTNIVWGLATNALTTANCTDGAGNTGTGGSISNWPVNFAATNVYKLCLSNGLCISNVQGLVSNYNQCWIYLYNTNTVSTYYLSFAGGPLLYNGLSNGYAMPPLSRIWLYGAIVGTNWQADTANWTVFTTNVTLSGGGGGSLPLATPFGSSLFASNSTAASVGTALWMTPAAHELVVEDFDDFYSAFTGRWNEGTGASGGWGTSAVGGHPGIVTLQTGTSSSGYDMFIRKQSSSSVNVIPGYGTLYFEWIIETPITLSSGGSTYTIRCGMEDISENGSATIPNSCIDFQYSDQTNSGNWQLVVRSASGTKYYANTGLAVAAGTWYALGAMVTNNGASVIAFTNHVAAVTNNLGTAMTSSVSPYCGIINTGNTSSRAVGMDLYWHNYIFTTER